MRISTSTSTGSSATAAAIPSTEAPSHDVMEEGGGASQPAMAGGGCIPQLLGSRGGRHGLDPAVGMDDLVGETILGFLTVRGRCMDRWIGSGGVVVYKRGRAVVVVVLTLPASPSTQPTTTHPYIHTFNNT